MDIGYSVGIVGSIASIISLFIAAPSWRSRAVHAIYVLIVTVLGSLYVGHSAKLSAYTDQEKQAQKILQSADLSSDGSTRGFILASLSFLEKNKDSFPDTYASAKQLAVASEVFISKQDDGMDRLYQGWRLRDVGSAMKALLVGIAGKSPDSGEGY
ncbi:MULTISPECIES: hypothetical protein [unclassified Pseudomonas]|uniref:hypothetical protein n=1 Tax=unclassified Pseudomonas TaxID=196821 RepID=UPI0006D43144|nr:MULTISPECIES: hypothetical protein [unclassified Pseudomonas]